MSHSRSLSLARRRSTRRPSAAAAKGWVRGIREAESKAANYSKQKIADRVQEIRDKVEKAPSKQDLIEFSGIVAECIFRTNDFRLHDVQVQAIAAGASGAILEMQTGEGKTVVTGAIAAIQSLTSPSVHVGTTNTYLAARDLESLAETFEMVGCSFGLLPEEPNATESRRVYRKRIVYGPGYQYGFDYLRDQMYLRNHRQSALGASIVNRIKGNDPYRELIQPREHHVALIDEADSVMIDEAMTPLIISIPSKTFEDPAPYLIAKKIADGMKEGVDYTIELPAKKVEVTDEANQHSHDEIATKKNLNLARPWRIYITNAIRANQLFKKNVDYVVVDGEVQIVDQYTGRILPDRTWQDGLHQAVEAKENVPIKPGRESTTQITRQRYLQMYDKLTGLTGTAVSVAPEFLSVYHSKVMEIPTNKKCIRQIEKSRFFSDQTAKVNAIADDVLKRHATGQPILVGTKTIGESKVIDEVLRGRGLTPNVLNGVQDKDEAQIVAEAGLAGSITIATNMAGRGTDIKPDAAALEAGGLHVIGSSPNNSKRIDRQLVGRAARQGQPGSAQFYVAADDSIFVDNASTLSRQITRKARKSGESADFSRELWNLQDSIEARNFKQRTDMILRDNWMDSVREAMEKE